MTTFRPRPPARTLVLIDGENIVLRFESMLARPLKMSESITRVPGLFVWHPHFANSPHELGTIIRVGYYMSVVGDDVAVDAARDKIGAINWNGAGEGRRVFAHIFKKPSRSQKTKNVDIGLTIDALRHTYQNHIDQLYLYSGDGDYIPLVQEVMRQGKQVVVGAFSEGLNPGLKRAADAFIDFDQWCFYK